ncbi:MAG: phosphoserine phosphatase SerB, partial [Alteromonadales bacterium]|nr:phosphoserine phosphatase SerB [Alteromonadales bacterium]
MSSIANILPQSLEQYLIPKSTGLKLPLAFTLSEQEVVLGESTLLTNVEQEHIELVVFHQLTLAQLLSLQSETKLEIIALTAINNRNNQTSCRFQVTCTDFVQARKALAEFALASEIEAALLAQVPTLAEPGLLVMDMDSTTIEIECIDEIAKLAGVGEEVAEVTERAMLGELDFAQSLHQRVATLADSPETILSDVAKNIPLMAGLKPLIKELKKHNWRIAIASGGFTYFADHLKDSLN